MNANEWRKSSRSHQLGDCVEVRWRKSSLSGPGGQCVEVGVWKTSSLTDNSGPWCVEVAGAEDGDVLVRDTKDHGNGPVLTFSPAEWNAFLGGVRLGEFDLT
jgi:hypothetical protein